MKERTEYGEIWCLKIKYNNGSEIPPTAVGGWLKPSLQKRASSWANPTDGSRWIVKAQPSSGAGWTLTIHRLPSVGFDRSAAVDVGRVLTIHRLPSVGLWLAWLHLFFKDHEVRLFSFRLILFVKIRAHSWLTFFLEIYIKRKRGQLDQPSRAFVLFIRF